MISWPCKFSFVKQVQTSSSVLTGTNASAWAVCSGLNHTVWSDITLREKHLKAVHPQMEALKAGISLNRSWRHVGIAISRASLLLGFAPVPWQPLSHGVSRCQSGDSERSVLHLVLGDFVSMLASGRTTVSWHCRSLKFWMRVDKRNANTFLGGREVKGVLHQFVWKDRWFKGIVIQILKAQDPAGDQDQMEW